MAETIDANDSTVNVQVERYEYVPIQSYWFYARKQQDQTMWIPFSLIDVEKLERAYEKNEEIISTNGNRYDVNLTQRIRIPVYWNDEPSEIRRSKWFHSLPKDNRFTPFDETMDQILENLYVVVCDKQLWRTKHEINNGTETITFNNPNQMIMEINPGNKPSYVIRTLKRGLPEVFSDQITPNEQDSVQHLCFVVHGIGTACDMKFRSLVECVEDFRQTSRTILQSHFKSDIDNGRIHRVEFLPIYWHSDLHLDSNGVDNYLSPLTLPSVMKLRRFINTALADVLFYTSPVYCQRIVRRCINEMNRLYELFLQRNPLFRGQISVIGHSLGSVVLYDILNNQTHDNEHTISKNILSSSIQYERLKFPIAYFFALGSPIAMFLTVRGISSIGSDFMFPTCKGLFNIFHPCDPFAYRLEPLLDPTWTVAPVLLTHHKGRKRMHLELADGFSRATDMKRKMVGVFKNTMTSLTNLMSSNQSTIPTEQGHGNDIEETDIPQCNSRSIGKLNQGRRIDYVLQHRPIETINEYIFAFASHVSYWNSEDTILFILKEIFQLDGFEPEKKFETIEQLIKSNVCNYFSTQQTDKLDKFQAYRSPSLLHNQKPF